MKTPTKRHPRRSYLFVWKTVIFALTLFLWDSAQTSAIPLPRAETKSDIAIQANVLGGGPYIFEPAPGITINLGNGIALLANPNAKVSAGAAAQASAVSIAGADRKSDTDPEKAGETDKARYQRVVSYIFDATIGDFSKIPVKQTKDPFMSARTDILQARSGPHSASAWSNSLSSRRSFEVANGGTFDKDPTPLGSFSIRQATDAQTTKAEAEGATSNVLSRGLIEGAILKNRFNPPVAPVPAAFQPKVELDWDIKELYLRADPTIAFALSHHTVEMRQKIGDKTKKTKVGFSLLLRDGKFKVKQFFEGTDKQTEVADWFNVNTELKDNQFKLKGDPLNLKINVPLMDGFRTAGAQLTLDLENDNFESSLEIAPRANGQKGLRALHKQSGNPQFSLMHWKADRQVLEFDDINFSLLSDGSSGTNNYQNDPLIDPARNIVLRIDPLKRIMADDGLEYFAGTTLQILDLANGSSLYSAEMPVMVFDPSLFAVEGFNLFAPLFDEMLISTESDWLVDYMSRIDLPPDTLPQLFVGFPSPQGGSNWNNIWESSFDTSITASLSFTQPIPEPATLSLLILGLGVVWGWLRLVPKSRHS